VRRRTVAAAAAGPPRAFPMMTPRGARFVLAELVTWARSKGTRIEPKVRDFARTYLEHYERAIRHVDDLYQNVAKADSVVIAEQFQG
jgi:fibrillarin-like rRNA methylase